MKCKKCGSENLGVMFDVIVSAPIKYYYNFSKQAMRDKGVRLWGADWHKADIVCGDCYYSTALNKNAATNGDRIRGMSDEELSREMLFFIPAYSPANTHYTGLAGAYYKTAEETIQSNLDWLRQPAETEGTE